MPVTFGNLANSFACCIINGPVAVASSHCNDGLATVLHTVPVKLGKVKHVVPDYGLNGINFTKLANEGYDSVTYLHKKHTPVTGFVVFHHSQVRTGFVLWGGMETAAILLGHLG